MLRWKDCKLYTDKQALVYILLKCQRYHSELDASEEHLRSAPFGTDYEDFILFPRPLSDDEFHNLISDVEFDSSPPPQSFLAPLQFPILMEDPWTLAAAQINPSQIYGGQHVQDIACHSSPSTLSSAGVSPYYPGSPGQMIPTYPNGILSPEPQSELYLSSQSSIYLPTPSQAPVLAGTFNKSANHSTLSKRRRRSKPILCPVSGCPQGIKHHRSRRDLNRHLWARHEHYAADHSIPEEKEACRVCGVEQRKDNVKRHMRTKHGM